MLGSCFLDFFAGRKDLELSALDSNELDITDSEKLAEKFIEIKPQIVVNCAAYTAVDEAEKNKDLAFKVNSDAVMDMARLCKRIDAILIHFSTDYVFNGEKIEGYLENDRPAPINIYGESKAAGEKAIMENADKYYVIRTSWLFGPNGKNFVDTMIGLGQKALKSGTELNVVNDQVGSPTYTKDLCEAVVKYFIQPFLIGKKAPDFGIYHLTNSGKCSWYEFARKIFELKNMGVKVLAVSTGEFPRPAKRPACSILLNTKLQDEMKSWVDGLKFYLNSQ